MSNTRLFTSEYVSDGHPDKIADQISDAILDEALNQDSMSRVAVEAAVKGDQVMVFGEMTTNAEIDISERVRDTLTNIGYDNPMWGFDPWKVKQFHNISSQSNEIGDGVTGDGITGAGDQGLMFGYAVKETTHMMPLPLMLAREIIYAHKTARTYQDMSPFGPDAKAQVTIRYGDNGEPIDIDTIVLSSVHAPAVSFSRIEDELRNIINRAIKKLNIVGMLTSETKIHLNSAGPWTVGGPIADAGLTGRKIIVDTYGGAARHGGGAFSGKDPTKVDRSAAYAARHLAKLICDRYSRHRTEVQVGYAIGVPEPISFHVYGMHEQEIKELIDAENIDLSPDGIINKFNLRRPIYQDTAANGHMGRACLPWEDIT